MVFRDWRKSGQLDLEAVEMALRGAMHRAGAAALGQLLSLPSKAAEGVACGCGKTARYHDTRPKQLLTVLGPVQIERAYYRCPDCEQGQLPRDRELDVVGTECSPGVRRMLAAVGSEASFEQGRQQLELLAGLEVTTKAVERHAEAIGADIAQREQAECERAKQLELPAVCVPAVPVLYVEIDATAVPVVKTELVGRAGKTPGQAPRSREVKLGCVFTQSGLDQDGRPVRDETSTSYVGAIESAEEFGPRIYTEAWRRGWSRAKKKVVLGDGAPWIWNLAHQYFPGAIEIVDLYHARQHLWELAGQLFASDPEARKSWAGKLQQQLDQGKLEALLQALRESRSGSEDLDRLLENAVQYFEGNAERMRYPEFRAQGLFVGSGVIEAGCKTVIGARLKRSGMFWTVKGANSIVALRCQRLSGRFEEYWENRAAVA